MSDDGQRKIDSRQLAERTGWRTSAVRILRNRGLRRLLGAFLAFSTAEYATWVAILLFAYERTGPGSVGIVAVLMLVPGVLVAPAVAVFGDRRDRRLALIGGYLAYGIGLATTATTMESDAPILVAYLVAGIGSAALVVIRPTQSAMLPALSRTPDELTSANGAAGIVEGAGMLLGPLLSAAVVSVAGPPWWRSAFCAPRQPGRVARPVASATRLGRLSYRGSGTRGSGARPAMVRAWPDDMCASRSST